MRRWFRDAACDLFGHRHGWGVNGQPYGEARYYTTDGINRTHFEVRCRCNRCGREFTQARFHGSLQLAEEMTKKRRVR